jgi:endonuclease/exonuclease/phosphatase family metal-dependent hydrolase
MIAVLLQFNGFCQTKLMSFNIRYNNKNDAENWWEHRKKDLVQMIDFYHPEFIGIQEGLINQVTYIDGKLKNYMYVGVGRDDGEKGEFSAIFFDTTQFELLETETFWLSETPDILSVGWDASIKRICTYGAFVNKHTNDSLYIFNSHFDHKGALSRNMSAILILKKINEYGINASRLIVMGDFNCEPQDEPIQIFKKELNDAYEISDQAHYGPSGTFNGFNIKSVVNKRIDYIFTKNLKVRSCRHIDDKRKNNLYLSDHFPVLIEI